jgi:small conductance mechanosensitive channel
LPNGSLSTSPITNISGKGKIRVDMVFRRGQPERCGQDPGIGTKGRRRMPHRVERDVSHDILVTKLTENAIFFDVRVWTPSATYWETYYDVHEGISRQFALDGIRGAETGRGERRIKAITGAGHSLRAIEY